MTKNAEHILEVNNVSKLIGSNDRKGDRGQRILDKVSFTLDKGTITAVVGKSGSGKSTLLSIVSGIDAPTSGTVRILGEDYYNVPERERADFRGRNIGMLFQNYHLIPELTCEENIRMPLCFSANENGRRGKEISETGKNAMRGIEYGAAGQRSNVHIDDWIRAVGLYDKRNLFPRQLSGGEQQRAAILRAVVNQPKILFADEPTGALDSRTGRQIIEFLIAYAHKSKMTILLVTHDMEIADMCDRRIEIVDGRIK